MICDLVPLLDRLFALIGLYNIPGMENLLVGFLNQLYGLGGCADSE